MRSGDAALLTSVGGGAVGVDDRWIDDEGPCSSLRPGFEFMSYGAPWEAMLKLAEEFRT